MLDIKNIKYAMHFDVCSLEYVYHAYIYNAESHQCITCCVRTAVPALVLPYSRTWIELVDHLIDLDLI